jgi:hypothetical protein
MSTNNHILKNMLVGTQMILVGFVFGLLASLFILTRSGFDGTFQIVTSVETIDQTTGPPSPYRAASLSGYTDASEMELDGEDVITATTTTTAKPAGAPVEVSKVSVSTTSSQQNQVRSPAKPTTQIATVSANTVVQRATTSFHTPAIGVHAWKVADLREFETRAGRQADLVAVHIHWGNENKFPQAYAELVRQQNGTLFIFWNPMNYRAAVYDQGQFHYQNILSGQWDAYIEEFAADVQSFGGPVVIIPFEEVNGYWTPWGGLTKRYGSIEEYKLAFQYLHNAFAGVPNAQFGWVINHVSVPNSPENSIATYYPGDAYVDIIGINAFNFDKPWLSFETLIAKTMTAVLPYGKPIYITSTASAEGVGKANWITEFLQSHYFTSGSLKGWIWFNENKEKNWLFWSDLQSELSLRNGLLGRF